MERDRAAAGADDRLVDRDDQWYPDDGRDLPGHRDGYEWRVVGLDDVHVGDLADRRRWRLHVVPAAREPGFETGSASPWTSTSGVVSSAAGTTVAHSGTYFAWLDGYGSAHTDTLTQSVTVPATCTSATFSFYLRVTTAETTTTTAYDKLTVKAGSTTLATYSNLNASAYTVRTFSLSAFIGSTVSISFSGVEDSSLQTSFLVDDTSVAVS